MRHDWIAANSTPNPFQNQGPLRNGTGELNHISRSRRLTKMTLDSIQALPFCHQVISIVSI